MIGPINLDMKHTGERSAGNRPAAFDVAGAGNVTLVAGLRAIAKAVESPPAPTGARASSRLYRLHPLRYDAKSCRWPKANVSDRRLTAKGLNA